VERVSAEIAFYEGEEITSVVSSRQNAIRMGERGLVKYLADQDKAHKKTITAETLEPRFADEVADLRNKGFYPEQIKIFYILRDRTNFKKDQPFDEQERINHYSSLGLNVRPNSASELESTFSEYFRGRGSFKDAPGEWADPSRIGTTLNEISRASTDYRDRFMVAKISRAVREQKRVFAVVGWTHAVMQEPAIRALLKEIDAD
jgi:hypothetical protein